MAANITGLHPFANDVGPLPLKLLDDSFSTLAITLNTLSTFSNFYSDTGTTNAYTIQTTQAQLVAYSDGLQVTVRIANTNTGASTLNVNGLGAMPILTSIGSELQPNALVAGSIVTLVYNAQRQAWQIASGGGGGQITAPLHVTSPSGQSALTINVDGTGYLGDFNGNGLAWDGSCNYTFEGGATLSGILPDFRINTVVPASAGEPQLELRADGYSGITAWPSGTALNLEALGGGALGTPPCQLEWGDCNWIFGGASVVNIPTLNATAGALGTAPNQIVWNAAGQVTLTGTATLPMPPLVDLPGINITNPQNGQALVYDSANNQWVNGAADNALATLNDVALTTPANGQALTYNATTQRWVNSAPVLTLEGLTNTHISGPASGQVLTYSINPAPGWVNATIPGYNFLTHLGIGANPQAGWVLTWDGNAWVGAEPGQVAQFPLTSLTDVGITTPLNRQVLTYDAPSAKWINAPAPAPTLSTLPDVQLTAQTQGQVLSWNAVQNRWENSSLPGGSVIALSSLMDTNISNAQNNQVLTWNYADGRWENKTPAISPVITSPQAGQTISYNGTNWVNATPTPAALATLSDVTLTSPANGQLLTYNGTRWVNGGSASITASGSGIGLNVGSSVPNNWTAFVQGTSGARGMLIAAGAAAGDYAFLVRPTDQSSDYLRIMGDGTGNVGRGLSWTAAGAYNISAPTGNTSALIVNQSGTAAGLLVQGTSAQILAVDQSTSNMAQIQILATAAVESINFTAASTAVPASLRLAGGEFMGVSTARAITIPAAASGNDTLTVKNPTNGFAINADGSAAGGGAIAAGGVVYVYNAAWSNINFSIQDNGSGWMGPAASKLSWGANGNYSITQPPNGTALSVFGAPNSTAMIVQSNNNTQVATQNWMLALQSSNAAAGASYGLSIRAGSPVGTPSRDIPFQVMNVPGSFIFYCYGTGEVYFPLVPTVSASSAGNVIRIIGSSGQLTWDPSARRYKSHIRSLARKKAKELVQKLRVVTYRSKSKLDDPNVTHFGLIAEEVAEVAPGLVALDGDGKPSGVQMDHLAMLLIPLVQELLGMDEPEGEVYG